MRGNWLKEWRRIAGMTQQELEEKSGVSVRTITRIESGEIQVPRATTLKQLCDALEAEGGDVPILRQLQNGHDLLDTLCGKHQIAFNYSDCKSEKQLELFRDVLSFIQDVDMVWNEADIQSRFTWGKEMSKIMKEIEELGIVWFGANYCDFVDPTWEFGVIYAVDADYENILRV